MKSMDIKSPAVIPAQAGIQVAPGAVESMDSRLRGNDVGMAHHAGARILAVTA